MDESGPLDPPAEPKLAVDAGTDPDTQYVPIVHQATVPPRTTAFAASLPERFGRYRIRRCLGQGAMGAVYLADDTQLDRSIALKVPKLPRDQDAELTERFYREARAAATLRHPNLCPVYDAGEIDGVLYLAMAFIDGQPLSETIAKTGPAAPRDAAALVLKLAKALEAAHARGVVHRDLKPANIMIDGQNEPIVMDFGLARRMDRDDCRLTQEGLLMGSPAYMSPEQVEGNIQRMGPSCDIYSLGIILYELLTSQVPFQGSTAAVMGQIITSMARKPSAIRPGVDPALESICLRMIAKNPDDRFASMHDVAGALEAFLAGRPVEVTAPPERSSRAITHSATIPAAPARGMLVAPWMVWTAVGVVVLSFGVTWWLIAAMMRQGSGSDDIVLNASGREAIARGTTTVRLNDKELTKTQLEQGVELGPGDNTAVVDQGGAVTTRKVVSDADDPSYLLLTGNAISFETRRHRVARWVIEAGGKVNVGAGWIDKIDLLPTPGASSLKIEEIDLAGVMRVPDVCLVEIGRLGASLKRLKLTGADIAPSRANALKIALPNCRIET